MSEPFRVLITQPIPEVGLQRLKNAPGTQVIQLDQPGSHKKICQKIVEVDALLCLLTDQIDKQVILAGQQGRLKVIANYAVGFNNIDTLCARKCGIEVSNTPGVLTETTADFAFTLLSALARRVVEADQYVKNRQFTGWQANLMLGTDIFGKKLGIVGAGRIGQAMMRRAAGFNMTILYHSRSPQPHLEQNKQIQSCRVDLRTLLTMSDFVSVHVPLSEETWHMIDAGALRLMKESAFLINTSRGSVVDEDALIQALERGEIAGAALDVFEREPHISDRLLAMKNVLLAPHIASGSNATREKMALIAADNILDVGQGKKPRNSIF